MKCDLNKRKIIIAGGTGFIGKKVVELLSNNDVQCYVISRNEKVDHKNIKYIKIDLNKLTQSDCNDIVEKYGVFDEAIYLAANIPKIGEKKENYLEANTSTLVPLINFMEGFSPYIKRIVYASSIDVVGTPKVIYYDEKMELNPTTPYAVAKLCGENYVKSIANKYGLFYTMLRFSQVYGPFEPIVRVIPILLKAVKENRTFNIYGEGMEKRCFLYVDDAAVSVIKALEYNKNDIFNIAGKSIDSINDLINIVEQVYRKDIIIERKNSLASVYDNIPSIEKAKNFLGYEPMYSLLEGIQKICEVDNYGTKTI